MKIGVDLSHHNKDFDFSGKMPDFAIIRSSFGQNKSGFKNMGKDKKFEFFYKKCKKHNIPVGAYHYLYAYNLEDVKREANNFLDSLKNKTFEYPVFLDIESKAHLLASREKNTEIIKTFCNILEKAGYYVGVYASKYFFENKCILKEIKIYDLWIAHYPIFEKGYPLYINPLRYKNTIFSMWQFTNKGESFFPNIGKTFEGLDVNICYKDNYVEIIKHFSFNNFSKIKVFKKTNYDIAKEVIKGEWKNYPQRKKLLEDAGYNYEDIRKIVNYILKK